MAPIRRSGPVGVVVSDVTDSKGCVPEGQVLLVSPPGEVAPPHDVKGGLEGSPTDMTPQIPQHAKGMGGPSADLMLVHKNPGLAHGTDVPILPAFRRGSHPASHRSYLEELCAVGGLEQGGLNRPGRATPQG